MFHEIRLRNDDMTVVGSPWWIFALAGVYFIVLSTSVLSFLQILERWMAGCLIFCGHLFVGSAWKFWAIRKLYRGWRRNHWLPW